MAPFVKDNDGSTATQETAPRPSASAQPGQTVALEVPVSVNGARAMEGTDKREPFSETTKTVLIFGNGAVIRLNSSVASGQLLFLTNENTKKEVVCQVVKSRNYRNVSGYVELEFTEPVVGFWGMRFPSDRIGVAPATRPAAPARSNGQSATPSVTKPVVSAPAPKVPEPKAVEPRPTESKIVAPVVPVATASTPKVEQPASQKPVAPVPAVSSKQTSSFDPSAPVTTANAGGLSSDSIAPNFSFDSSRASDAKASFLEPANTASSSVPSIVSAAEPEEVPAPPVAAKPEPVAPVKLEAPVVKVPEPVAPVKVEVPAPAKPEAPAPENLEVPAPSFAEAPRAADAKASFLEPASSQNAPVQSSVPNLLALFESKPTFSEEPTHTPAPGEPAADQEMEDLKKHTARLQEQLSGMSFSGEEEEAEVSSAQASPTKSAAVEKERADNARKLFESMKMQAAELQPELAEEWDAAAQKAAISQKPVEEPAPAKVTSLEDEQLGIPAWLEPLARNTTAPLSTQEVVEREKAKRLAEKANVEELISDSISEPVVAEKEERPLRELPVPTFGELAPLEDAPAPRPIRKRKTNSGLLIGAVAAGVLLAAGGAWWYITQPAAGSHAAPSAVTNDVTPAPSAAPAKAAPVQDQSKPAQQNAAPSPANSPEPSDLSLRSTTAKNSLNAVPATEKTVVPRNAQPAKNGDALAAASAIQPNAEPPKKSAIGDVHLAAPVASPRSNKQASDVDAGINLTNDDQPGADALNSGLAQVSSQPAAPVSKLPVGGDVKEAVLISSVPPLYPAMARTQRVSGSVVVDALIGTNGRVTSMKVVSGPSILQQAAMDAIKQWKYRPAMLDGNPVAMTLTVTIQFRAPQ